MPNRTLGKLAGRLRRVVEADPEADALHRFRTTRDPEAFAALVRRHGSLVLAACRRVLGDTADVEDAFQATFLVLFRSPKAVRDPAVLGSWLYGVAHRVALRARARHRRRKEVETAAGTRATGRHAEPPDLSWKEAVAILHAELDRLPDTYRLPLLLCYLEGLTRDEAAGRLGLGVETVRGRLERGRERLRARLAKRGVTLSAGLLAAVAAPVTAGGPSPQLVKLLLGSLTGPPPAGAAALVPGASAMTAGRFKLLGFVLAALAAGAMVAAPSASHPAADPPKADPPAAKGQGEKKPPAADERGKTSVCAGRVLGPDGKPAGGAKLFEVSLFHSSSGVEDETTAKHVATADADGRFRVTFTSRTGYIIAHAPGCGVDWFNWRAVGRFGGADGNDYTDITLRLPKDYPVAGRVIDTEGKPVAGASVRAEAVYVPDGDNLGAYLAGVTRRGQEGLHAPGKRMYALLDRVTGSVRTDADGRFLVPGCGAGRVVTLGVLGAGLGKSRYYVVTHDGFDPQPLNDTLLRDTNDRRYVQQFRATGFAAIAGRMKPVVGTVTDAATGKPVAGARVSIGFGDDDGIVTRTDAAGRYRLDGVPKDPAYTVAALGNPDAGQLNGQESAADTTGFEPVRIDVRLPRGVVLTGRVFDRKTGKGVTANVRAVPLSGNEDAGKPGFEATYSGGLALTTHPDGSFRILTVPGKVLVTAYANRVERLNGERFHRYRRARPDPDHKGIFEFVESDADWMTLGVDNRIIFLGNLHGAKVATLKPGGENRVDVAVDPGVEVPLKVVGPDGRPVDGAVVAGLTDSWPITFRLPGSAATVYALDPKDPGPREVVALHPGKKLGGRVTVQGDEKEPVALTLGPLGAVKGRFLDPEGAPLAGAKVTLTPVGRGGRELYRSVREGDRGEVTVTTDKDGRFTTPDIVPGVRFNLYATRGRVSYTADREAGERVVKPGETLDLGDRKTKANE
jgi:RNA polymerase sigma factor (sigma-70 family)